MKKIILLLAVIVSYSSYGQVGSLQVKVLSVKSTKGNVLISLYRNEDGFPTDPKKALKSSKSAINGSSVVFDFDGIPYGTYAVIVAHDENGNAQVDTNFIGIPKEGIGTSNNAKGSFGPPKFADAKFEHSKPETQIEIKLSY